MHNNMMNPLSRQQVTVTAMQPAWRFSLGLRNAWRVLIMSALLLLMFGLTGCGRRPKAFSTNLPLSSAQYLNLAAQTSSVASQSYKLQALAVLLQQHKVQAAQNLAASLRRTNLDPRLQPIFNLYQARVYLLTAQPALAQQALQQLLVNKDYKLSLVQIYQLQLWLGESYWDQQQLLPGLQHMDQAMQLLPQHAELMRQQLQQKIWQALLVVKIAVLQQAQQDPSTDWLQQGWLQLALITRRPLNWAPLLQQLKQWQQTYKKHPAAGFVAREIDSAAQIIPPNLQRVAVLLPADGPYVNAANAVRRGLLAAYYQSLQAGRTKLQLNFIDINQGQVVAAYNQALSQHAQLILGPLSKENIRRLLSDSSVTVPTVVFNNIGNNNLPRLLYQFGLSPIQEAQQVAMRAWQHGHQKALLIVPTSSWGQNVTDAFKQQWDQLGGQVVDQVNYTNNQQLSEKIASALEIDQSIARNKQLSDILGKKLRFTPRRRHDFDMVFLLANPGMGRQIQPLLKYYYAGGVPIYATSMIYSGDLNPAQDQDLNHIIFCDMPWAIDPAANLPSSLAALRKQLRSSWPKLYAQQPGLFALGVDTFRLLGQLRRLNLLPQLNYQGATGRLSLSNTRQIQRSLNWAQFRHGIPRLLPVS